MTRSPCETCAERGTCEKGADGSACTGGRHGGCGRRYWEAMGLMDEIRRALLGDKEAAKRLTEKGVLLPCPWCGKP